jgi:hypothetical protein
MVHACALSTISDSTESPVIPGRERKLAGPESITTAGDYGFRARRFLGATMDRVLA